MVNVMDKLLSDEPYLATRGVLLCVVYGKATKDEADAIIKLSKSDGLDYRVAGRTLHDWIVAAMDVLGIRQCHEPLDSDAYDLIKALKDPAWLSGMEEILS